MRSKRLPAIAADIEDEDAGTERFKQDAAESNRESIRLWAVLSLLISLAMMAILSKKHFANAWEYAAALIVISSVALYLRKRIVRLGPYAFVAILLVILGFVVLFGS